MGTVFNKEEMLVLLQDFHRLTGLRTVVFDTARRWDFCC